MDPLLVDIPCATESLVYWPPANRPGHLGPGAADRRKLAPRGRPDGLTGQDRFFGLGSR